MATNFHSSTLQERDVVLAHLCVFPVMLKQHLRGMRSGQVRSRVKFSMKKSRISNIFHSPTLQEILGVVEALGVREK